jgi:hypothetical protein
MLLLPSSVFMQSKDIMGEELTTAHTSWIYPRPMIMSTGFSKECFGEAGLSSYICSVGYVMCDHCSI